MSFPCPSCEAPIDERPDRVLLRCEGCGVRLRSRSIETNGANPVFELHVVGKPETRRRVEVAWDDVERRHLSAWLLVASLVTVALVLVLFVLARIL